MDGPTALGLVAVIVLVLANGFFVATEFAIVAVRRSRLEQLAREGHPRAALAQQVVGHLDAYIAACQLGITMASLALGWIGEPALAHLLEPPLERLVGRWAPAAAHGVAVGVAFAVITGLHIVAGELAPKGIALQRPEATTLWVARPLQLFYLVFRWPITALNAVGNGVLRLMGLRPATGHEMVHGAEELELLVKASQRAGLVEESEARIAARAFQFADLTAGDLMTPRTELEAIPVGIGREDLLRSLATSRHSRLLVYDGSLDNILGVMRVRDLVPLLAQPHGPFDIRPFIRPVLTVPESRGADDLLEDMRKAGRSLAVVVDEYGGTAGIVTLGDLVRALVGRIDEELTVGAPAGATPQPDGSLLVDGLMRVHELEELLGAELDEAEWGNVGTVGGLIMARLDRMPRPGDEVTVAGHRLRVEELDGRRVAVVRLYRGTSS
ncbi:MAG: HlyC/CorC family transporter [Candidatus Rokubacteria bacterium]|nr:HlyC/CorC family transporter [Candidatus Rokubacteria bacterium]